MPEPIFMKLSMYIIAPEPISTVYFINPSHQSVCLYTYHPIVARQRLGKNITAATNTHATIEELLDASFSLRLFGPCPIKGDSVGLYVYLSVVDRQRVSKHVPAATRNRWRCHVVSKESRRLVLPRIFFFDLQIWISFRTLI
jgi:hypothetical protein